MPYVPAQQPKPRNIQKVTVAPKQPVAEDEDQRGHIGLPTLSIRKHKGMELDRLCELLNLTNTSHK